MTTLSTHILDTARGLPAQGVPVAVYAESGEEPLETGTTDADGRYRFTTTLAEGVYRVGFRVSDYQTESLYPRVDVTFRVTAALGDHLHVPLLLSPFGYSTYRGS